MTDPQTQIEARCIAIADAVVPNYRNGKRAYSCTSQVARMWQAAYDGAAATLAPPHAGDAAVPAGFVRINREQYPEIIQAARWMDEDNGTPHFEPGVGFIVDDPHGLTVPARWVPHLPVIEGALAGLDHVAPHPLDEDTIKWLAREGKEPTLYESAAHCFVSGEYTPMTAMANSSEGLWIAARFLNERFEDWEFNPAAGFAAPPTVASDTGAGLREALRAIEQHINDFAGCDDSPSGDEVESDARRGLAYLRQHLAAFPTDSTGGEAGR